MTGNDDVQSDGSQTLVTRREWLSVTGAVAGTALVGSAATGNVAAQTGNEPRINLGDNFHIDDVDGDTLTVTDASDGSTILEYDATVGEWAIPAVSIEQASITNETAVRVHVSSDQSLTAGSFSDIAFDSEDQDTLSEFDTTNYTFSPDSTGEYLVQGQVSFQPGASGDNLIYQLLDDQDNTLITKQSLSPGSGSRYEMTMSKKVELDSDRSYRMRARNNDNDDLIASTNGRTFWTIRSALE